jgi:5-formyltetrahydrofolate cyclo-ligase
MSSENPGNNGLITKSGLREAAIAQRAVSTPASGEICRLLESFLVGIQGFVVIYDALDGEVDLGSLWDVQSAPPSSIAWAITRTPEQTMDLSCHEISVELEMHRWGYRQPVADAPQIADSEIAAVLVPGLAFDLHGGRIGWGAGYYDRFLKRVGPETLRIGVSDGYLVQRVPMDDHDVPMTHVVTAQGVVRTSVA